MEEGGEEVVHGSAEEPQPQDEDEAEAAEEDEEDAAEEEGELPRSPATVIFSPR